MLKYFCKANCLREYSNLVYRVSFAGVSHSRFYLYLWMYNDIYLYIRHAN